MAESKQSWKINLESSELISVFSGTKQILTHSPDPLRKITIDVTVTESDKE